MYSKAELEEIFKPEALSKALHYKADIFENCLLENKGNGKFVIKPLPAAAQLSCINGVVATDYDNDGNTDLLVAGNAHSTEIVYGWMDASLGVLLKGDGKGNFTAVPSDKSGLFLMGDVKGLVTMYDKMGNEIIAAAANSDSLIILITAKENPSKIFYAAPLDAFAEIEYKNGHRGKQEFYYGSGYLSQSARAIKINQLVKAIQVTDVKGNKRSIRL